MDIEWPLTYCSLATLGEDAEEDLTMSTVDYRFIDADQHTYEPGDCFSRHMEEDWGFNYEGRIFAAGNMALDDLEMAVAELERLAKTGIRFLNFPPRPPLGGRPDDLPSEIFKHHISITPFYGDDIPRIMNLLGPDRVLLGTDWPHPEGVFEPSDFLDQLPGRSETEVRSFMRDNGARVFGLSASGGTG